MADGSYDIADESASRTAWLTFTDTDGPENGGQFAEKSVEVTFTEADPHGKGRRLVRGQFRPHRRRRHAGREKIGSNSLLNYHIQGTALKRRYQKVGLLPTNQSKKS